MAGTWSGSTQRRVSHLIFFVVVLCLVPVVLTGCASTADLTSAVPSPDGKFEARLYYINPGAAASSSSRVDVVDLKSGKAHVLWAGPPINSTPEWVDAHTLVVGEQTLDISQDRFNWYEDAAPGAYPDPEQAVTRYVRAVAIGDLAAVQKASVAIVGREELVTLRKESFETTEPLVVRSLKITRVPEVSVDDQATFTLRVVVDAGGKRVEHHLDALASLQDGAWQTEWVVPSSKGFFD